MRMKKISVRCCVDLGFNDLFGLNAFTLSPTRWIEATNAIGLFTIVTGTVPCHVLISEFSPPASDFRSCRGLFRGTFCNFAAKITNKRISTSLRL